MAAEYKDQIYVCPHCGNKTPIKVRSILEAPLEETFPDGSKNELSYYFTIGQCSSCHDVLVFGAGEWDDNPTDINEASLLYPKEKSISLSIPKEVRESYEEAKKVKKSSTLAFAVMTRRTLEFLCMDQGARGRSLNAQIRDLATKNIIPRTLSEMTDILRILGNIGAHATNIKIETEDVAIMEDFLSAILEYVYIAPAKIERIKKRLGDKKNIKS